MSGFPIQPSKVQRPPLRDDVLSRPRLNDQLDAKSSHRVVLLVAEAGYGKTTLLADWTRRTTRRVAWYRLDTDDRDWLTFLHHVVAAGRAVDDRFGFDVEAQLESLGPDGPTREQIVATLARELSASAADGLTVVLDDYHLVDDNAEVREVLRGLIERVADGVSFLISTRLEPELALSRFRARAEVADLDAGDLRFDEAETERLFREAYHRPLEPDILVDLAARTEGWAASLQLVRTAIRERTQAEVRAFVRRLSGAGGELYDYLAEEVVGRLPEELQQFLMRASLLEWVIPDAMRVVFDDDPNRIDALLVRCESLGLLSRRGDDDSPHRFHPLVREFLLARVTADLGDEAVKDLHRQLGSTFEGRDWRLSATHFHAAGDNDAAWRVIDSSTEEVVARGEWVQATDLLAAAAAARESATTWVIASRVLLQQGDFPGATEAAQRAVTIARAERVASLPTILINASSVHHQAHDIAKSRELALEAIEEAEDPHLQVLARGLVGIIDESSTGNMPGLRGTLNELRIHQERHRHWHYLAITELNLSITASWMREPNAALVHAERAHRLLDESSRGYEGASIWMAEAIAFAQLGDWHEASKRLVRALSGSHPAADQELLVEAAMAHTWYGRSSDARELLDELREVHQYGYFRALAHANQVFLALDEGAEEALREARDELLRTPLTQGTDGELFKIQLALARAAIRLGDVEAEERVSSLEHTAQAQASRLQIELSTVVRACLEGSPPISRAVAKLDLGLAVSILASDVARHLDDLDEEAALELERAAIRRPQRWLPVLRLYLTDAGVPSARLVRLIELIGTASDAASLIAIGRRGRRFSAATSAGRRLAQQLAPRAFVRDLGRIEILLDGEVLAATARRKVLALVAALIVRPGMAATRDQVLDALWPDLDPATALNSLNQTIYFFRRLLNPKYVAASSPEYIHFEGETVWLDGTLVATASAECLRLFQADVIGDPSVVERVQELYLGKFALDFAYEEWASDYRDTLHASYLAFVERAMEALADAGSPDTAIGLGRRALTVDPTADHVEARLLRLYRLTGAHAAAAEQYAHYATVQREQLGVEPTPIEDL